MGQSSLVIMHSPLGETFGRSVATIHYFERTIKLVTSQEHALIDIDARSIANSIEADPLIHKQL